MPSEILTYHPILIKLIKYLDTTQGREKVLRLLQYSCKILATYSTDSNKALITFLQSQFTVTRKYFRFAKPLNHFHIILKYYNSIDNDKFLIMSKNFFLLLYLFFDQINLLKFLRIININNNKFLSKNLPLLTNYFWLFSIISSLTLDVKKYLLKLNSNIINKSKEGITDVTCFKELRKIIWDSLDGIIVLNNLEYLHFNPRISGLAGVITSWMAIEDIWSAT